MPSRNLTQQSPGAPGSARGPARQRLYAQRPLRVSAIRLTLCDHAIAPRVRGIRARRLVALRVEYCLARQPVAGVRIGPVQRPSLRIGVVGPQFLTTEHHPRQWRPRRPISAAAERECGFSDRVIPDRSIGPTRQRDRRNYLRLRVGIGVVHPSIAEHISAEARGATEHNDAVRRRVVHHGIAAAQAEVTASLERT